MKKNKVPIKADFLFNTIFCLFPISFILGNLAINLNILAICLFSLFFFQMKIFKLRFNNLDKLLFIFFFYTLVSLLINYVEHQLANILFSKSILLKTIFFFKYLLLYIILRFLISENIINLQLFKSVGALCAALVAVDIFIQFIFGKNIIGMVPPSVRHFSSFFGNEMIAGGYLQKFSLFIFFLPFFIKKKRYYKNLIQFLLYIIVMLAIILSGNRMPLVLYLLSFFIFLLFIKISTKQIISSLIILFVVLFLSYKTNLMVRTNLSNFYYNGKLLISTFFDAEIKTKPIEVWQKPYVTEFQCAKTLIQTNPFFGGGIRSYRTHYGGCNSHPHNYFLEIISDLGIIGVFLITFFIYRLLHKTLKYYKEQNFSKNLFFENTAPVFTIVFLEFFPFRTSGSFFTTNNATVIFIMVALLVSFCDKNIKKI